MKRQPNETSPRNNIESNTFLLDYMDIIVTDYLAQNPDRHDLDYIDAPACAILLIDNGKRYVCHASIPSW